MFRRLLIANRGEIALRIARACTALGIEPVMIYSEIDRDAPWLEHAAARVCVGGPRASESYLNQDAILQGAEQTDCQAIHPGYGFLAENAIFAKRCIEQALAFVGPDPPAIRAMGDKVEAKRTMAALGLPTIPGSAGVLRGADEAREIASRVGYPVLLKAAAGGGGRGMRRCDDARELGPLFAEAALEAEKAFSCADLYLEKLVERARHVEFQVLADGRRAVHLGERECSIQRRHQKLVEEAPSPAVDRATRERVGGLVARAVAALGYKSAGTVEFLRMDDGRFFFMEMNTRLQVEHPVTEECTGIDIVAEQIRLAANEPLALDQDRIACHGHAIEFRVNAEDPARGFQPDPGTIERLCSPRVGTRDIRVRWDSAAREGWRIPSQYDSLVGKLIVHGRDREAVLEAAGDALRSLQLEGVHTTVPFHLRLLENERFRSGDYDLLLLAQAGLVEV